MAVIANITNTKIFSTYVLVLLSLGVSAQRVVTVTNPDGKPIEDAQVTYCIVGKPGTQKLTLTNNVGIAPIQYTESIVVMVTAVGYRAHRDTVAHDRSFSISLKRNQLNLDEAVITGQFGAGGKSEAVQNIRVIDSKRITQQGAVSLRDVLTNELNIRLTQDGVLGSQISMMGLSGQNVKILIDGVPVIGRMDGNIDVSQLNLNNVERIEIVEGPMSVIYGTDALGGVINLITRKPSSKSMELKLNTYYESVGTYNVDGSAGVTFGKWGFSASGGRNFFDGFSEVEGEYIRWKQWKPKEQYIGDAQLTYKHNRQQHRLFVQAFDEKITSRNNPVVTPYSITGFDDYFNTFRSQTSLYSDVYFNNKASLNLIQSFSAYERRKNTFIKNLNTGSENLTSNPDDHDTTSFNLVLLRATYTTHNRHKWNSQFGYDINLESGEGKRLKNTYQEQGDFAAFYTAEYKPASRFTIKPGLRLIYNTRYQAPVIPSLNFRYELLSNLTFRGSYAKGFRAPTLKELFLFFVDLNHNVQGNELLKAEKSDNVMGSLTHTVSAKKIQVQNDISIFYNEVNQMISLAIVDPNTQLYRYVNIDKFKTHGINLNSKFSYPGLIFTVGYAYTGRYNQLTGTADVPEFSYASEYRANITYTVPVIKTDVNLFYKYNGELPGFASDANSRVYQTTIQSFHTLDASLSRSFAKKLIHLTVGAKNLTNVTNVGFNSGASVHSGGSGSMPTAMGRFLFTSIRIYVNRN